METPQTESISLEAYEKMDPVCTLTIDDKQSITPFPLHKRNGG